MENKKYVMGKSESGSVPPTNLQEEIKKAKEKLDHIYELKIGDGLGEARILKMTGWEIYRMVEGSLATGVNASQQIEGETKLGMEELEQLRCQDPVIMADRLEGLVKMWGGTQ